MSERNLPWKNHENTPAAAMKTGSRVVSELPPDNEIHVLQILPFFDIPTPRLESVVNVAAETVGIAAISCRATESECLFVLLLKILRTMPVNPQHITLLHQCFTLNQPLYVECLTKNDNTELFVMGNKGGLTSLTLL